MKLITTIKLNSLVKMCGLCILLMLFVSSCRTAGTASRSTLYDPAEVADLSRKLNIELSNTNKDDDKNMTLYAESSLWLGVPYRYGGTSRKGVDCSGLSYLIYKRVYGRTLARSTDELANSNMKKISKNKLRAGDLVFFATSRNKRKITHVGVFLKDGYFVHASTSRGVVVSHIEEEYYRKAWKKGGRLH